MKIVAAVGSVVIVIDQITKVWAASALVDRDIDLFWTARFNLHRNFGSAFGLGAGLGRWLGIVILVVIAAVLWYARTMSDRRVLMLLGAVAGGAIGNIIDRVVRAEDGFLSGGVIDFIDFQWWPIFNVADMAVVTGAIGLMVVSFLQPELLENDSETREAAEARSNADPSDTEQSDADLSDADLSDADLSDAEQSDADLSDAEHAAERDGDSADSDGDEIDDSVTDAESDDATSA